MRAGNRHTLEQPGPWNGFKEAALQALTPPVEYPLELEYLEQIARVLVGNCHGDMGAPRYESELDAYLRNRGMMLESFETDAVMACVSALAAQPKPPERKPRGKKVDTDEDAPERPALLPPESQLRRRKR